MSNIDQIREQKQQYLRENIIDQNYDPNEFMDFIGSVDIDQLTFLQLSKIVDDFVRSKQVMQPLQTDSNSNFMNQFSMWGAYIDQVPVKKEEPKFQLNLLDLDFLEGMNNASKPNSTQGISPTKKQTIPTKKQAFMSVPGDVAKKLMQGNDNFIVAYNPVNLPSPIFYPSSNQNQKASQSTRSISPPRNISSNIQNQVERPQLSPSITVSENFAKVIPCKKLINKSRLQGNEDVIISGHEIINPNVFVPKYVLYIVTINPLNIEVKRRIKDFQTLRILLIKFFPTTQIPHLERVSRLNETQPITIKRQILFLESFLNSLLMKKQLRCKLLEEFLLCKDLDLLKKIFKQYEKLSGPRAIQGLFTPSGELELKMTPQNRKYVNENISLNQFMKEHFIKLKGLYDTLIEGFQTNTKTISQIEEQQKIFKEKIRVTNNQFTPQYQCPQLQKSIERVELMHRQWGSSFKTQVRIIQNQIRHLYRYEQDNIVTLNQMLKYEEDVSTAFSKRGDKDQANREPYESKKLEQFKISLESPSKNITVLKHQAAYIQQKVAQQCLNYLSELSQKLDNKFKLFCSLQYSICQDMESVWKQFDSFYK